MCVQVIGMPGHVRSVLHDFTEHVPMSLLAWYGHHHTYYIFLNKMNGGTRGKILTLHFGST